MQRLLSWPRTWRLLFVSALLCQLGTLIPSRPVSSASWQQAATRTPTPTSTLTPVPTWTVPAPYQPPCDWNEPKYPNGEPNRFWDLYWKPTAGYTLEYISGTLDQFDCSFPYKRAAVPRAHAYKPWQSCDFYRAAPPGQFYYNAFAFDITGSPDCNNTKTWWRFSTLWPQSYDESYEFTRFLDVLSIYDGSFDAASPCTNLIAQKQYSVGFGGLRGSRIVVPLDTGHYVLVITSEVPYRGEGYIPATGGYRIGVAVPPGTTFSYSQILDSCSSPTATPTPVPLWTPSSILPVGRSELWDASGSSGAIAELSCDVPECNYWTPYNTPPPGENRYKRNTHKQLHLGIQLADCGPLQESIAEPIQTLVATITFGGTESPPTFTPSALTATPVPRFQELGPFDCDECAPDDYNGFIEIGAVQTTLIQRDAQPTPAGTERQFEGHWYRYTTWYFPGVGAGIRWLGPVESISIPVKHQILVASPSEFVAWFWCNVMALSNLQLSPGVLLGRSCIAAWTEEDDKPAVFLSIPDDVLTPVFHNRRQRAYVGALTTDQGLRNAMAGRVLDPQVGTHFCTAPWPFTTPPNLLQPISKSNVLALMLGVLKYRPMNLQGDIRTSEWFSYEAGTFGGKPGFLYCGPFYPPHEECPYFPF